jgi:hypothetical protein
VLTACLLVAALAAGVTGAWSPCGLSMVETLAPSGYAGRMRATLAASATFAVGALAGGAATFGGLALIGAGVGEGSATAVGAAAVIAAAAAAAEARGLRIVPQVRRQVPEAWRRTLPITVAAAGYGVLLGLGFTTFVLSYAVWALAAVCVALGDPPLGLALGIAFGVGRALPVVLLAPAGAQAATAAMGERPATLRGLRRVDAAALAACALALALTPPEGGAATQARAADGRAVAESARATGTRNRTDPATDTSRPTTTSDSDGPAGATGSPPAAAAGASAGP